MAQHASNTTPDRRGRTRGRPLRAAVILATLALVIAACGTNSGSNAPGGSASQGPGSQAPAVSSAAAVGGTLTVWAMGNEGVKLNDLADAFMEENPGDHVNVTPVDWGQAVAKLQTAIAGHQTPDVSQMGTDMMGQFAATGALEAVPANFDPATFFEGAWNTNIVGGTVYGVPVVRRDQAALLPHRHRREGRYHGTARDVGRADGHGQGDAGQGRRQVRHLARNEELAGVRAFPVVEWRRRHGRHGQVHARTARGGRSSHRLPVLLQRRPLARRRSPKDSTSRPPSSPARTRCSSPAHGTSA